MCLLYLIASFHGSINAEDGRVYVGKGIQRCHVENMLYYIDIGTVLWWMQCFRHVFALVSCHENEVTMIYISSVSNMLHDSYGMIMSLSCIFTLFLILWSLNGLE